MTEIEIKAIDTLKSVLGTMVLMPKYRTDTNQIGNKIFEGNEQVPILMGKNRELVENKLIDLISRL